MAAPPRSHGSTTSNRSDRYAPLRSALGQQATQELGRCRWILDEAEEMRAGARRFESPLMGWENEVRTVNPMGQRWTRYVAICADTVRKARDVHAAVYERQREAVFHLRAALASIRLRAARTNLPPYMVSDLDRSEALRIESLEELYRAIGLSEQIEWYPPQEGPSRLLALLGERRRLLAQAAKLSRVADKEERRALAAREVLEFVREETVARSATDAAAIRERVIEKVRDEELARLRQEIAVRHREIAEAIAAAEREREAALALTASLTRAPLDSEPEEAPVAEAPVAEAEGAESIGSLRSALEKNETQLEGLRKMFATFREDVATKLGELGGQFLGDRHLGDSWQEQPEQA